MFAYLSYVPLSALYVLWVLCRVVLFSVVVLGAVALIALRVLSIVIAKEEKKCNKLLEALAGLPIPDEGIDSDNITSFVTFVPGPEYTSKADIKRRDGCYSCLNAHILTLKNDPKSLESEEVIGMDGCVIELLKANARKPAWYKNNVIRVRDPLDRALLSDGHTGFILSFATALELEQWFYALKRASGSYGKGTTPTEPSNDDDSSTTTDNDETMSPEKLRRIKLAYFGDLSARLVHEQDELRSIICPTPTAPSTSTSSSSSSHLSVPTTSYSPLFQLDDDGQQPTDPNTNTNNNIPPASTSASAPLLTSPRDGINRNTYDGLPPPAMRMAWVNAFFGRLFWASHTQDKLMALFRKKLDKKIAKIKTPKVVKEIRVDTLSIGPNLPLFDNVVFHSLSSSGSIHADCDVTYLGGFHITIGIDIYVDLFDMSIPIKLSFLVKSLRGRMRILIAAPPATSIWFGFYGMPDLDLEIDSEIGSKYKICNIRGLADIIANKIKAKVIKEFVLPNMDDMPIPMVGRKPFKDSIVNVVPQPLIRGARAGAGSGNNGVGADASAEPPSFFNRLSMFLGGDGDSSASAAASSVSSKTAAANAVAAAAVVDGVAPKKTNKAVRANLLQSADKKRKSMAQLELSQRERRDTDERERQLGRSTSPSERMEKLSGKNSRPALHGASSFGVSLGGRQLAGATHSFETHDYEEQPQDSAPTTTTTTTPELPPSRLHEAGADASGEVPSRFNSTGHIVLDEATGGMFDPRLTQSEISSATRGHTQALQRHGAVRSGGELATPDLSLSTVAVSCLATPGSKGRRGKQQPTSSTTGGSGSADRNRGRPSGRGGCQCVGSCKCGLLRWSGEDENGTMLKSMKVHKSPSASAVEMAVAVTVTTSVTVATESGDGGGGGGSGGGAGRGEKRTAGGRERRHSDPDDKLLGGAHFFEVDTSKASKSLSVRNVRDSAGAALSDDDDDGTDDDDDDDLGIDDGSTVAIGRRIQSMPPTSSSSLSSPLFDLDEDEEDDEVATAVAAAISTTTAVPTTTRTPTKATSMQSLQRAQHHRKPARRGGHSSPLPDLEDVVFTSPDRGNSLVDSVQERPRPPHRRNRPAAKRLFDDNDGDNDSGSDGGGDGGDGGVREDGSAGVVWTGSKSDLTNILSSLGDDVGGGDGAGSGPSGPPPPTPSIAISPRSASSQGRMQSRGDGTSNGDGSSSSGSSGGSVGSSPVISQSDPLLSPVVSASIPIVPRHTQMQTHHAASAPSFPEQQQQQQQRQQRQPPHQQSRRRSPGTSLDPKYASPPSSSSVNATALGEFSESMFKTSKPPRESPENSSTSVRVLDSISSWLAEKSEELKTKEADEKAAKGSAKSVARASVARASVSGGGGGAGGGDDGTDIFTSDEDLLGESPPEENVLDSLSHFFGDLSSKRREQKRQEAKEKSTKPTKPTPSSSSSSASASSSSSSSSSSSWWK